MKKLIFTLALLIQTVFVFAEPPITRANTDDVKMYRQPGTSAEVLHALKSTDEVVLVRKHNGNWSIVNVNGLVGYVLTSEITTAKSYKRAAKANHRF